MKTNREWLNELAANDVDALQAWFDAEHVDAQRDNNGTCPISNGTASDEAHSKAHSKTESLLTEQSESLSDEADSREKLEADVRDWVDDIGWLSDKETQVADFIAWLDRQAAITKAECNLLTQSLVVVHDSLLIEYGELKAQVDKLHATIEERNGMYENQVRILGEECKAKDGEIAKLREQVDRLRDWINDLYTMWADTSDLLAEYQEGGYVKVVRCRDCAYFDTRKCKSQWPFCLDAFCWWGKRKEGGE